MWWVTILDFLILAQTLTYLLVNAITPKPFDVMMPNITEAFLIFTPIEIDNDPLKIVTRQGLHMRSSCHYWVWCRIKQPV
jgi:hypothetical protein